VRLSPAALLLVSCATSPVSYGADAVAGTADWEAWVRERLLVADADGSGSLEVDEARTVTCDTWREIDSPLRLVTHSSLAIVYGFGPGLLFRGARLGISPTARDSVHERLAECLMAPLSNPPAEPVASAIRELSEFPVSSDWERRISELLVGHYDADRSGRLDTPLEIRAISCETLRAIDDGARSATGTHLGALYGIEPGYVWIGNALGFDESIRDLLAEHLLACDLETD